jgi:hypothetical protein
MKLYPKEINSMKALDMERKKLRKQLKELDEQEFFSLQSLMNKQPDGKDEDTAGGFNITSMLSLLPVSNPLIAPLIGLIQNRLARVAEKKKTNKNFVSAEPYQEPMGAKVKKVARSVAFELITGYLKWKAIELTYKGVKHIIKTRKEKKEAAI